MSRVNLIMVLCLCVACTALGIAFGKQIFGCQGDDLSSDHVLFDAHECFQPRGDDGSVFLECRRVVKVGKPAMSVEGLGI